jgi:hypothetical protein
MTTNATNPEPELLGYSTLIGATYSSVKLEEIPIAPPADAQWRISFDGGAQINGHLIDVVLNHAALKVARKAAKKARRTRVYHIRNNEDYTEQEMDAKIKELEEGFIDRFMPAERDEAYRQSIRIGNRPLHDDLAALPDWVQQEIFQQQSPSDDDLQDNTDSLPGNENTSEVGVDDTSPTSIETAIGESEPLPGNENTNSSGADDTSPVVIEATVGQVGVLPSDKIEIEAKVDDASATTKIEAGAVQPGLHLGKNVETDADIDGTTAREINSDADGLSGLHIEGQIETQVSVGDTSVATETESVVGQSGNLSVKEIETKLSVDDTSSREIELDADRSELRPSRVKGSTGTMKQPVTATEQPMTVTGSQLQMPQASAEQANLTQRAEEQLRHQLQHLYQQQSSSPQSLSEQPSTQQPPHTQQSSSTQATAANIPATITGLPFEEIYSLIFHGKGGPTSAEALRVSSNMSQTNILQVPGVQEMIAEFCTKEIWRRYCNLPAGSNATPEFKDLTSNSVDDRGVRAPTHPIPASFLERLVQEMNRMFEECRPDRCMLILRVIRWPGHKGQNVHALLSEEVVWLRGPDSPWSKQESLGEIGLLLECVGILNKGSMWKG